MNRFRGPPFTGPSKASPQTLCQKCLKRDDYQCTGSAQDRPYASRPSRTQQLANPKLMPKLTSDVPNDLLRKKGIADEQLAKKEEERARIRTAEGNDPMIGSRKRPRSISSYSSTSVSTISTDISRSPSPKRVNVRRGGTHHGLHKDRHGLSSPKTGRYGSRYSRSSSMSYTSQSSYERRHSGRSEKEDRNTRRRRSSISPDVRGRQRSHSRRKGSRRTRSRSSSRDRSQVARNRQSMTPGFPPRERLNTREHQLMTKEGPPLRDRNRRYTNDDDRYGSSFRDQGRNPRDARPPPPSRPTWKERSLSPFSKRLALTQAMNMGN